MNPLDIVFVIILSYCLIRGIFRGLVKELSSIIGVFGGFYAAYNYYPLATGYLSKWITNVSYLNITSFMLIFCVIFLAISIMGILLKYLLRIVFLGWTDRILGGGFGAVKGILIVSVLLLALTSFLPKGAPVIHQSKLSPHVTAVTETMAGFVSKDMKKMFELKIKEIKKVWHKKSKIVKEQVEKIKQKSMKSSN